MHNASAHPLLSIGGNCSVAGRRKGVPPGTAGQGMTGVLSVYGLYMVCIWSVYGLYKTRGYTECVLAKQLKISVL